MWQRFTERARRVVFHAQEAAHNAEQDVVTPEHLMLGMLNEDDHVAARMLAQMGVDRENLRAALLQQTAGAPRKKKRPDCTLNPRAKRCIDLAYDEARQLDCNYIGTEHLLLGLVREGGSTGLLLTGLGATLERARAAFTAIRNESLSAVAPQPAETTASAFLQPGHLGKLRDPSGAEQTTLADNESTYTTLQEIAAIKDRFAYQELLQAGHLFVVPLTGVKLLQVGSFGGYSVRILEGEFAGKMGWISPEQFEYIGPDTLPFP